MAKGRITKRSVDALKVGQALFDIDLRGSMVRARTSLKVYAPEYVVDGRQRIISLSEGRVLRMIAALDIYPSDNRTDQAKVNG